jgi:CRISPR-associated protein Csb2
MSSYLCLSVQFLDATFHGRQDGGALEWPPSPLRLFQALVAASAARWGKRHQLDYARPALRWLEQEPPPEIIAPLGEPGAIYRLSVPNNAMDLVGRAWSRGNTAGTGDANPATHRAMKTVHPTRLLNGDAVHYLWELPDVLPNDVQGYIETLGAAARSIVALGWGVDLVAGNGQILSADDAGKLPGERWRATADSVSGRLRVPTPGTLEALANRHEAFLHRLDGDGFTPVPALTSFAAVGYRRSTDPPGRPFAVFELWQPLHKLAELPSGKSRFRPFDPVRHAATVAGMVRHVVGKAAQQMRPFNWTDREINTFVHGHTPEGNDRVRGVEADQRFAFLPLPTINPKKVESIRRVLVVGPPGATDKIDWVRKALPGRELLRLGSEEPIAMLSPASENDPNVTWYTGNRNGRRTPSGGARTWSTVTPVVLPGHEDPNGLRRRLKNTRDSEVKRRLLARLDRRVEALLRKAFTQAGLPPELVREARLEWREVGFRPGTDLAQRYTLPPPLTLPRYHVRVRWPVPIRGPLAVGAARYRGLGVFAIEAAN